MKNNLKAQFTHDFYESLPNKPYCTDRLGVTYIRHKKSASKKKYIQINPPVIVYYLIIDLDHPDSVLFWYDKHLPPPYWTSKTPENSHCHVAYKLANPVCTSDIAHIEPLKYLAAIQSAFVEKLGGDRGYAGLLTKNPLHPHWQTKQWTDYAYSLDELADFVDLKGHPLRGKETFGLGRNCVLFDTVRYWAYHEIRKYWAPDFKGDWFEAVYNRVAEVNTQFTVPLQLPEVRSIAKSIYDFTCREFTPSKFRLDQSVKGRRGGLAGSVEDKAKAGAKGGQKSTGGGRKSQKDELLPVVLQMIDHGYNQSAIAEDLQINQSTISRWLKSIS